MKHILSALLILTLFISCNSDKETNQEPQKTDYTVENEKEITDYIAKNNLTAKRTDSGLYYVINEPGTGAQPTSTSTVTVAYKGYYSSGKVFDQSTAQGLTFGLNQVIKGWTEGIPYFKVGGSGVLLVPSHLGYGPYDYNGIPGGSVLIFDVKLLAVK
ncbi:FKBP-type peptidyl-prolyl cis-trans isomerase [Flavobacterium sp. MR2016-29]|uniref:FKBP-type peptidyl-prolyl cis-trans isomerase n=1 Tax=Flavobacterium sp. MR2016-29 TaxID=2783795 RepID=UPI00188CE044|nr:FKBP-type peptidyl-prolyl cis-trans isomerase [Flavobacterium sp. MR2016-29]MBF4493530.1 FKBP-type peptidyl-prolyl cis-trans isomerase [Flavobacterium sp. MR2016-29]